MNGAFAGLTLHRNAYLDADMAYVMGNVVVMGTRESPGWEARQIVRDGLRDVLDWLKERRA